MVNLVEILRYCPVGFSLYSPIFGNVTFLKIETEDILIVLDPQQYQRKLFKTGHLLSTGTCGEVMLWPSSDRRTWNGFKLFKKGDIITSNYGLVTVVDHVDINTHMVVYQAMLFVDNKLCLMPPKTGVGDVFANQRASVADQVRMHQALKAAGCILSPTGEIVKKGFDFDSIEPFSKVLVRDCPLYPWCCSFYSHREGDKFRTVNNYIWKYCIPYNEDTKSLRGTTSEAPEFYKQ